MPSLKARARSLNDLAENAAFYFAKRPLSFTDKAAKLLTAEGCARLAALAEQLLALDDWREANIEAAVRAFAEGQEIKLGAIAQPLRAALTGSHASPGIFEVMALLGQAESLARIGDLAQPPA
jgi:glutamyl-tRNA synthetase